MSPDGARISAIGWAGSWTHLVIIGSLADRWLAERTRELNGCDQPPKVS